MPFSAFNWSHRYDSSFYTGLSFCASDSEKHRELEVQRGIANSRTPHSVQGGGQRQISS